MPRTVVLPTAGFLLEHAPGRFVLGEGPLTSHAHRDPEEVAAYAPDFLLTDPAPWLHPAAWRETTREELLAGLRNAPAPRVTWQPPDRDAYVARFTAVMRGIEAGTLHKGVPIVVERGTWEQEPRGIASGLLRHALAAPGPTFLYAAWTATAGILGASPEILFVRHEAGHAETVAMAGTYPDAQAADLDGDPKEVREHASVVDDIVGALQPLGTVTVGAREVVRLPTMAHLKTDIAVALDGTVGFDAIVRALHPTAALGVAPRSRAAEFLPALGPSCRGRFGAPFGIEWPDGRAHVLVAIRNVQWDGADVRLGAGAGIIAESTLEREWEELALKRAAVKALLGL